MDDAERDDALSFLREGWKDAAVFAVSAKTGAGVADFADYILAHTSRLLHPDLAYGGSDFCAAMGKMAQYGRQFYVEVCCNTFDGNAYLRDLAEAIRKNICAAGRSHAASEALCDGSGRKLRQSSPPSEAAEVLRSTTRWMHRRRRCRSSSTPALSVPPAALSRAMDEAIAETAQQYQLAVTTYMTECFDAAGPGRL